MKSCATIFLALLIPAAAWGQAPAKFHYEALGLASGERVNLTGETSVIYRTELAIPGATWLQVHFTEAVLPAGTVLRTTAREDDARQNHTASTLRQWQNRSAYFNGNSVVVELVAGPGAEPSRLSIAGVWVGDPQPPESICGPTDDRVLADEGRSSRIFPVGCTAWTFDDAAHCQLTAGHCSGGGLQTIEFHVPLSDPNGSINHPGPEDQYAVDPASVQAVNGGVGNDWGYFGVFPNTETDLTPFQAEGEEYVLGIPPVAPGGETISIFGYGTTDGVLAPREWSQVGKIHQGPFVSVGGTSLQYAVDTSGGNSGSAVFRVDDSTAIGIHTHAGCSAGGGANNGTSLSNTGLQAALANPLGVCGVAIFADGFESGDTSAWTSGP